MTSPDTHMVTEGSSVLERETSMPALNDTRPTTPGYHDGAASQNDAHGIATPPSDDENHSVSLPRATLSQTSFLAGIGPRSTGSAYPLNSAESISLSSAVKANVQRAALSPDGTVQLSTEESFVSPHRKGGADVPSDTSARGTPFSGASLASNYSLEKVTKKYNQVYAALRGKIHGSGSEIHDMSANTHSDSTKHANDVDGDGDRIYRTIRSVVHAADEMDSEPYDTLTGRSEAQDWRDDDNTVLAPSTFFQSTRALESSSNRVMESIIARGHAAQTDAELRWLFRQTHLLSLLTSEELDVVVPVTLRREYSKGDLILPAGCKMRHVFTVVWGEVDVFKPTTLNPELEEEERAFRVSEHMRDHRKQQDKALTSQLTTAAGTESDLGVLYTHTATLLPGQMFGTESFVYDETSKYLFRASGKTRKTVVALIPFTSLSVALANNARFAQGVGSAITGSVEIFGPIRQFCRYVFSSTTAQNEYLPLWSILESYTKINNVIHTKIFSKELDTGAWGYAINRLPENLTSTFCFDLVHALPPFVASRMRVEARAADVRKSATDAPNSRTSISYIRTKERRRCTWHLGMEGKTMVLLRDGFTDLLDFLTMLCMHIVESNKLRGRVQGMVHPPAIDILDEYLRDRDLEAQSGSEVSSAEEITRIKGVLQRMPLTPGEQAGLLRNWGDKTLLRVYEVMMHREEYNVRVDPSISRKFQTTPFHEWALNLRGCVLEKLGLDRASPLPDDLHIDVISSNTHCIKNLISSFNRKYRKEILDYAERHEAKKLGHLAEWHNIDDVMYVSTTNFIQNERPDLKEELNKTLEENGITVLQDTAMTGLQVDVIPVHLLNFNDIDETIKQSLKRSYYGRFFPGGSEAGADGATDGRQKEVPWETISSPVFSWGTSCPAGSRLVRKNSAGGGPSAFSPNSSRSCSFRMQRHFIINMDFAFGAQAEGICRAVFGAFGKSIRSVSVMGKAGGLTGKRGDIQLASHVLLSKSSLILEDNQDELRNCRNQDLTSERLRELAGPSVDVHHGKVLTVTGTILQNVPLLRYYKHVWRCVGAEMEGSYFARVIEDFYRQGIAHPGLVTRFAYYTSDLPLAQSEAEQEAERRGSGAGGGNPATLSAPMAPQEGVPPLYAIARSFLERIVLP